MPRLHFSRCVFVCRMTVRPVSSASSTQAWCTFRTNADAMMRWHDRSSPSKTANQQRPRYQRRRRHHPRPLPHRHLATTLISTFIIVLSCVDLIVVRKVEKDIQTQINKPGHKSATRATCQVTGKRSQIPLWIPPTKSFCLVAVTLGKSALHRI